MEASTERETPGIESKGRKLKTLCTRPFGASLPPVDDGHVRASDVLNLSGHICPCSPVIPGVLGTHHRSDCIDQHLMDVLEAPRKFTALTGDRGEGAVASFSLLQGVCKP